MEYEKTLLELMERVSVLEDRVDILEGKKAMVKKPRGYYSDLVKDYIKKEICKAKSEGKTSFELTSGDIQREVGLKNRLPLVCNAMRDCMDQKSEIVHETPSGQSSTFTVKWVLSAGNGNQ